MSVPDFLNFYQKIIIGVQKVNFCIIYLVPGAERRRARRGNCTPIGDSERQNVTNLTFPQITYKKRKLGANKNHYNDKIGN